MQIPIQTVANNTVTVTFKDAVLTLKVTPQITEAGTVILNVEVENNTPTSRTWSTAIPPINTQSRQDQRAGAGRRHRRDRRHLPEQRADVAARRTPFLGNMPAAGLPVPEPARSATRTTELLLFITPRIVKG